MTSTTEARITATLMGSALVLLGLAYLLKAFFPSRADVAIFAVPRPDVDASRNGSGAHVDPAEVH